MMRATIGWLFAAVLLGGMGSEGAGPNVLYFMADDMDFYFNECPPGYSGFTTPVEEMAARPPLQHIDRVRKEGVVFDRAYTVGPKCAPSRFSILTGKFGSRGVHAQQETRAMRSSDDSWDGRTWVEVPSTKITGGDVNETLPWTLKHAGYTTVHSGKWHLFAMEDEEEYWGNYDKLVEDIKATGFDYVAGAYTSNFKRTQRDVNGERFSHNLEWMVEGTLKALDDAGTAKPFFVYFAPTAPHNPTTTHAFGVSDRATPAGRLDVSPVTTMRARSEIWAEAEGLGGDNDTDKLAGHIWVDEALGALLTGLEERQQLESTLVVVTMDHGMGAKAQLHEAGARVMLAVRHPVLAPTPGTARVVVTNADVAATVMALAGATPSYTVDGTSFVGVLADPSGQIAEATPKVIEMYQDRAIIMGRYKYVSRSPNGQGRGMTGLQGKYPSYDDCEQLYDLVEDGAEQKNLVGDAGQLLETFRELMACHDEYTTAKTPTTCTLSTYVDTGVTVGSLATSPTQTGEESPASSETCQSTLSKGRVKALAADGCRLQCGTAVPLGWIGGGEGPAHCNRCYCRTAGLMCTQHRCSPLGCRT